MPERTTRRRVNEHHRQVQCHAKNRKVPRSSGHAINSKHRLPHQPPVPHLRRQSTGGQARHRDANRRSGHKLTAKAKHRSVFSSARSPHTPHPPLNGALRAPPSVQNPYAAPPAISVRPSSKIRDLATSPKAPVKLKIAPARCLCRTGGSTRMLQWACLRVP
jgi:hypothetical protein